MGEWKQMEEGFVTTKLVRWNICVL